MFRVLLAISGVALLMTTGIAWVVAGRILKPVRLVRATAAQLTEQDLTRRIPVHGNDDVAALAETFNAMLDRLERAFATQRLFVDDAGHELRTPITIVRGHLELMGDDPAEREETVRLVTDELDRMSRIVEDLLLLAKAERPDFVTPEPVQLAELTADVFVKARTLGDRDWVLAEVADRETRLDPQRITQAMVQLAQNAVQHTTAGQTIRIGSRAAGARIELYVADTGPGVQPQDAEVIFERFRRARHGAGPAARAPDSGCRSSRRSPRARRPGRPARHRGRRRHLRTHSGRDTLMNRILIVEDEERIAAFVEKGLRANGFTTTAVADGEAGYEYALTGGFDLIVLDIGLPGRDGFTVLRELREARVTTR